MAWRKGNVWWLPSLVGTAPTAGAWLLLFVAMAVLYVLLCLVFTVTLLALHRLYLITPYFNPTRPPTHLKTTPHVLFLLGSGGHTAEMLSLISALPQKTLFKRTYVFSSGDSFSAQKATTFESHLQPTNPPTPESQNHPTFALREIPRARKVGQSWVSTPWSCIVCLLGCMRVFTSDTPPDVIVCNGPGSAVMMIAVCFLFKFFGLCSTRTIYVESFARVGSLSLSGRILYPFVDRFVVQWPGLKRRWSRAEYRGVLV